MILVLYLRILKCKKYIVIFPPSNDAHGILKSIDRYRLNRRRLLNSILLKVAVCSRRVLFKLANTQESKPAELDTRPSCPSILRFKRT